MHLRSVFSALLLLGGVAAAQLAPDPQIAFRDLTPEQQKRVLDEISRRSHVLATFGDARTCYTMRSYIFAREAPGSDVMRLVREQTCTPARKFSSWSAERQGDDKAPQPRGAGVKLAAPVLRSTPQPATPE
jgi:hypothetical protein